MPFCDLCLQLDIPAIIQTGVRRHLRLEPGRIWPYYVPRHAALYDARQALTPFHESLESLYASARSCELCHLIQTSADMVLTSMSDAQAHHTYEFWLGGRDDAHGFQILGARKARGLDPLLFDLVACIGLCVEKGSQLGSFIKGRTVLPSPLTSPSLDKIRGWIKQCAEQHKHLKPRPTLLPTRVLDIQNYRQRVVMYVTKNTQGRYAALSHCWGSTPTITLSSSTFKSLSTGVRFDHLPQTFKDAIWLTHQLGIRYLWIDSLCILQDDPKDWLEESARMGEIYGNSFLTIAACRASNSQEGFLGERLTRSYVSIPIHWNGISGEALAFPVPVKYAGTPNRVVYMEEEPLTTRAWALQERYLSPLTLHFSRSMMYFECGEGFMTEDNYFLTESFYTPSFILKDYSREAAREQCHQDWRKVVEQYSRRNLTVEDDKLLAVGGLASRFALASISKGGSPVPGHQYLAGLWLDDMIRNMCWSIDGYSPAGVRPQKCRAPTWSWASVDGAIDYRTSWADAIKELAIVEDAHVDLETPGKRFGKVLGGWISLKALQLRPYAKPDSKSLWVCEDGVIFRIVVNWDAEPYQPPGSGKATDPSNCTTEIFVTPLGWVERHLEIVETVENDPHSLLGPFFIILKAANQDANRFDGKPVFERVGFGTGVWLNDESEGTDRAGLERLIVEKFTVAKEQGRLQNIIIV